MCGSPLWPSVDAKIIWPYYLVMRSNHMCVIISLGSYDSEYTYLARCFWFMRFLVGFSLGLGVAHRLFAWVWRPETAFRSNLSLRNGFSLSLPL